MWIVEKGWTFQLAASMLPILTDVTAPAARAPVLASGLRQSTARLATPVPLPRVRQKCSSHVHHHAYTHVTHADLMLCYVILDTELRFSLCVGSPRQKRPVIRSQ